MVRISSGITKHVAFATTKADFQSQIKVNMHLLDE